MDVPARYSIDEDMRRPRAEKIATHLRVYLDGDMQRMVTAYDIDLGAIECIEADDRGYAILDRATGEFRTITKQGRVQVYWRKQANA